MARLLPIAERLRFCVAVLKSLKENKDFARAHPDISFPPADIAYDAYNWLSYRRYWESGQRLARFMFDSLIAPFCLEKQLTICEWGCGAARILRHMPSMGVGRVTEAWGTDYNARTIEWCQANIEGVNFALNELEPPLPFEDDRFDLLYSVSVYTHLSEKNHAAWLAENLRVVRPGGFVAMTLSGDNFRDRLLKDELRAYEDGELVVRGQVHEGKKWYTAFHSPLYVRKVFLKGLEIVVDGSEMHIAPRRGQDIWMVRKRC